MTRSIICSNVLVASLLVPGCAWASEAQPSAYTCAAAAALPADADEDSRRIACEIPDKYQRDVSMAQFVGRLIRLHDVGAWKTTDVLKEEGAFRKTPGEGRGWLTLANDTGVEVRYFAEGEEGPVAFAAARMTAADWNVSDARQLSPPEPMSERERRLMTAKMRALHTSDLLLCTNAHPNTVVFESEEDGRQEILVFVMSAWTDDAAPLGGYHMFRLSQDGSTVLDHFAQTKGCVAHDADDLDKTEALFVTHLTSAAPTMFHVFMSLQYRKPVFVATAQNGLLWKVEQGRIFHEGRADSKIEEAADAQAPLQETRTGD